jgi:hypothetical protein
VSGISIDAGPPDKRKFESTVRPPPKYVKTLNWPETDEIASDLDKNSARFDKALPSQSEKCCILVY